jgi:hypothetical protein
MASYAFDPNEDMSARRRRRKSIAELLTEQVDAKPIQSPWQGAAKMANAGISGLLLGMEEKRDEDRLTAQNAYGTKLSEELAGFGGGGGDGGSPVTSALAGKPIGGPIKLGGFEPTLGRTLEFEGGVNPRDTNGTPSVHGINQKANPDVDLERVKTDPAYRAEIYRNRYWNTIDGDKLDPRVAHVAFDTSVIAGPGKARELLKASGGDPEKFLALREAFQNRLIAANPEKYGPYAKAWANRTATLRSDVGVQPGGMMAVGGGGGDATLAGGDTLQGRGAPDVGRLQAIATDPNAPQHIRERARLMLQSMPKPRDPLDEEIKREQLRKLREKPAVDPLEQRQKELAIKKAERDLEGAGKAPEVRVIKQPDGSEVAVQWDAKANDWKPLAAPEGGNAVRSNKPLTEAQAKDANFYYRTGTEVLDRMDKQDKALDSYRGKYGGKIPVVGNLIKPDAYRQAEQTGRELLAVILRKDTGAAVTKEEVELYGDMYLPVPNDDDVTIQQKRDGRRAAVEGIKLGLPAATILQIQREKLETLKERGAGAAPAGAAPPAQGGQALQQAKDAIARGAPREKVIQRLRENGIDPSGL